MSSINESGQILTGALTSGPETISGAISFKSGNLAGVITQGLLGTSNYNDLQNLPALNGITIQGSRVSEDYFLPKIAFDSTENWDSSSDISEKNMLYVYTDYQTDGEGHDIAGIKVGDGLAYIVDLPFVDTLMQKHMANTDIHITPEEREFWNNKNRSYAYGETLILTTL